MPPELKPKPLLHPHLHPLKAQNTVSTVFLFVPDLGIGFLEQSLSRSTVMLWTWILIGAWLGSMLGILILVLGIFFSGRSLTRC